MISTIQYTEICNQWPVHNSITLLLTLLDKLCTHSGWAIIQINLYHDSTGAYH